MCYTHISHTLNYIEPAVFQPTITVANVGTADSPQFTIGYGPFSTQLGGLSTFQVVVILSGDNVDTKRFGSNTLKPQNETSNK